MRVRQWCGWAAVSQLSFVRWRVTVFCVFFFFFQAEDGIRDKLVTGVQTCALPIWQFTLRPGGGLRITLPEIVGLGRDALGRAGWLDPLIAAWARQDNVGARQQMEIGRASCRERV